MPQTAASPFLPDQPDLSTMLIYYGLVFALIALLLWLTGWLGRRRPTTAKLMPYESGITPTGSARFPYPAPFYLVAIFFLIFDVESAFILSWAIAFERLGLPGWLGITLFIAILLLSLLYLLRKGGLEWGPTRRDS